jgi:hypothetical protein
MNKEYVWDKLFPFSYTEVSENEEKNMKNVCEWLCLANKSKKITRNETGNLMLRIRKDFYEENSEHWRFISESVCFDDFIRNIPEYMSIRAKFPSRDKEPLEEICFPWSNEKLYGKGINSNVREGM